MWHGRIAKLVPAANARRVHALREYDGGVLFGKAPSCARNGRSVSKRKTVFASLRVSSFYTWSLGDTEMARLIYIAQPVELDRRTGSIRRRAFLFDGAL